MQERAYSAYCSLKYLSGQGYLFQESQQSAISAFQSQRTVQVCHGFKATQGDVRNAKAHLHTIQ